MDQDGVSASFIDWLDVQDPTSVAFVSLFILVFSVLVHWFLQPTVRLISAESGVNDCIEPSDWAETRYVIVISATFCLPLVLLTGQYMLWLLFLVLIILPICMLVIKDRELKQHEETMAERAHREQKTRRRKPGGRAVEDAEEFVQDTNRLHNSFFSVLGTTNPNRNIVYTITLIFLAFLPPLGSLKLGYMAQGTQGMLAGFGIGALIVLAGLFYINQRFLPYAYG